MGFQSSREGETALTVPASQLQAKERVLITARSMIYGPATRKIPRLSPRLNGRRCIAPGRSLFCALHVLNGPERRNSGVFRMGTASGLNPFLFLESANSQLDEISRPLRSAAALDLEFLPAALIVGNEKLLHLIKQRFGYL